MSKVSIIIPSRNERFLQHTVTDLLSKGSDIEVIAVLDGYWPDPPLVGDERLKILHRQDAMGMRAAINGAAEIATGEWLMKVDGHCMFGENYDEILQADCDDNWVVIPRRYSLDAENWCRNPKTPVDYEFLSYPYWKPDHVGMHGTVWKERARERLDIDLDENMSFQGSCWFCKAEHFHNRIGQMQEQGYETFIGEPQEIGNKTWLGGGKVMVNKKTWYAHLHKGKTYGRGYFMSKRETTAGNAYSVDYWLNNRWEERVHDLYWLVERFWPVPSWPDNYMEMLGWTR
jgi:glycosyltransferase involved in cell wall biosynthesis